MKPIWLLDVDGVLNSFDGTRTVPEGYEAVTCNGYLIKYHPGRIKRIRAMHDEGLVEIRWLTTWAEMANEHLGPIGIPTDLVVVGSPPPSYYGEDRRWWKLAHVMNLVEAHPETPIVWTDDDIAADADARAWLDSEARGDRLLAVTPVTAVGLSDGALDEIEAFLRRDWS